MREAQASRMVRPVRARKASGSVAPTKSKKTALAPQPSATAAASARPMPIDSEGSQFSGRRAGEEISTPALQLRDQVGFTRK